MRIDKHVGYLYFLGMKILIQNPYRTTLSLIDIYEFQIVFFLQIKKSIILKSGSGVTTT